MSAALEEVVSNAAMRSRNNHPVFRCAECDSRKIEVFDPITDCAMFYCADCGAEAGTFEQLSAHIEEFTEPVEQEQRGRWLH